MFKNLSGTKKWFPTSKYNVPVRNGMGVAILGLRMSTRVPPLIPPSWPLPSQSWPVIDTVLPRLWFNQPWPGKGLTPVCRVWNSSCCCRPGIWWAPSTRLQPCSLTRLQPQFPAYYSSLLLGLELCLEPSQPIGKGSNTLRHPCPYPSPGGCSLFLLFPVAGRGTIPNVFILRSHDVADLSDTANCTTGSGALQLRKFPSPGPIWS